MDFGAGVIDFGAEPIWGRERKRTRWEVGFSRGALDRWTAAIRRVGVMGPSGALVVGPGWFWTLGAAAAAE